MDEMNNPTALPESLSPFDVEIVDFNPLRVYIFTYTQVEWEEAKQAVAKLNDLSPYSFIERQEGSILQGVYVYCFATLAPAGVVDIVQSNQKNDRLLRWLPPQKASREAFPWIVAFYACFSVVHLIDDHLSFCRPRKGGSHGSSVGGSACSPASSLAAPS